MTVRVEPDEAGARARRTAIRDTADSIMALLLPLTEVERVGVIAAVRYNPYFCADCGTGGPESPNRNCPCLMDE